MMVLALSVMFSLGVPTDVGDPGNAHRVASPDRSAVSPGAGPALPTSDALAAYREILLLPDPQGRVVAATFRFPVGSAQDPIGAEGTAFLLGRWAEATGGEVLQEHGGWLRVEVRSDEFLVTVLASGERWRESFREVETLLFARTPTLEEIDAVRTDVLEVLRFEEGAPVRQFEWERAALVLGVTHPGIRPVLGTSGSVGSIDVSQLLAYRGSSLSRASATVAVSGPLEASELQGALGAEVRTLRFRAEAPLAPPAGAATPQAGSGAVGGAAPGSDTLPAAPAIPPAPRVHSLGSDAAPLRVPSGPGASRAWDTRDRVLRDQQLTATWIALAYPFPTGTPHLLLEFMGHLVMEDLNPTPPDPGLYETGVSVMQVGGSPVLVVSASVDPRITVTWEARLLASLATLAESPPTGAFFELSRRRFRSSLLLELALPEERTRRIVRQASLEGGVVPDLELEVWRLEREAVAEAAGAAGPPRILLMGPESMMGR